MKHEVSTQFLDIPTNDGSCDAFLASPKGTGPFPAVLFLMDGFGLRPYLNEMAVRLASEGFIVLQPNILYRAKRSPIVDLQFPLSPDQMPQARDQMLPLVKSFNPEKGVEDIGLFLDLLSKQAHFNGKIGVTGYCMGGGLALRAAARYNDKIQAAASFHAGNLATEAADSPHTHLSKIRAAVYVAHADHDGSMPPEQMERFQKAVDASGLNAKVEMYPGAPHGYTMKDLPAYRADALERHWKELLKLFSSLQ